MRLHNTNKYALSDLALGSMTRGCLVCFEGIDGSGKSTIAISVTEKLRAIGVPSVLVDRRETRDCPDFVKSRLRAITEMLWNYPEDLPVRVLGDHHLIHLLVSWFHLFDLWILQPRLSTPQIVLMDTWFYKYLARFALKPDFCSATVQSWFDGITIPDITLWMLTKPETAWLRKEKVRQTESDQISAGTLDQRNRFLEYQTCVQNILFDFAVRYKWKQIDANPSIQEVSEASFEAILSDVSLKNWKRKAEHAESTTVLCK